LSENNPNTLEILFLNPKHYLYLSNIGQELLNNKDLFISKKCISSFYGYSEQQARRMFNKAARKQSQEEFEQYILNTINNASYIFKERHYPYNDSSVKLYIDKSHQEDFNTEIFMDINLNHYPLRDWTGLWNEMKSIVSNYTKFGRRNERAAAHDKLGKHQSCLIMLLMNAIDLLETGKFSVYQEGEKRKLLMDIRNKKYLDENSQPTEEFNDLLNEYKKRFEYAKKNTSLPDVPDYKRINEFKMYVNERIVRGDI
jgi:predicted nucleotidyltransferase